MPYSSDHDSSLSARARKPDPFASLTDGTARRRRFWLFELLMSPFQDHDERASYHIAGKAREAQHASGIRVSKAWNGNGNPNGAPRPAQTAAQAGFAPARQENALFSSADRRPAGH
jgi:hypothetical protein